VLLCVGEHTRTALAVRGPVGCRTVLCCVQRAVHGVGGGRAVVPACTAACVCAGRCGACVAATVSTHTRGCVSVSYTNAREV
jgi:hypothetical protein